jgi:hypothetical protein
MIVNWSSIEEHLCQRSRDALLRFAREHPDAICSFFAYEFNPQSGEFFLHFDTYENALEAAQENERVARGRRYWKLRYEDCWRYASMNIKYPAMIDYGPETGAFAYPLYEMIRFGELENLDLLVSEEEEFARRNETEDSYLEGNVYLVLWKVVERLIASDLFSPLHLASPFRVGFQFDVDSPVVLRILNWPTRLAVG